MRAFGTGLVALDVEDLPWGSGQPPSKSSVIGWTERHRFFERYITQSRKR
ncbi:MAG: hypothetical protein WAN59_05210 [Candidatus Baltobacteraceae bacterium]